jgi:hypothetical protein
LGKASDAASVTTTNETIQQDFDNLCLGSRIVAVIDDRDTTGWLIFCLENGAQLQIQTEDPVVIVDPPVH